MKAVRVCGFSNENNWPSPRNRSPVEDHTMDLLQSLEALSEVTLGSLGPGEHPTLPKAVTNAMLHFWAPSLMEEPGEGLPTRASHALDQDLTWSHFSTSGNLHLLKPSTVLNFDHVNHSSAL